MKFTFLDGATGTNLMKAGLPQGVCVEKWVSENKEKFTKEFTKHLEKSM